MSEKDIEQAEVLSSNERLAEIAGIFGQEQEQTQEVEEVEAVEGASDEAGSAGSEPEAPKPEDESPETGETPAVSQQSQKPLLSEQLASLAKRERQLREREQALKNAEEAAKQQASEQLVRLAVDDPAEFYRQLGVTNPADIALSLYSSELGEDAPPEIRERARMTRQQREAERQMQEMQQFVLQQKLQAYSAQLDGFLQSGPADNPYLNKEYSRDAAGTVEAMMMVADEIATSTGRIPTARQVAAELERRIEEYVSPLVQSVRPAPEPEQKPKKVSSASVKSAAKQKQTPEPESDDDYIARAKRLLTS